MSDVELQLKPAPELAWIAPVIHLVTACVVVVLPAGHWGIQAVLLLVLASSCFRTCRTIQRRTDWRLLREQGSWQLVTDEGKFEAGCRFEFVSTRVVVVRLRLPHQLFGGCLVLTRGSGSGESWRRLHILATVGKRLSGVADNDILGGKINGNKDRVPGNL